jgi:Flp pilus assembly protein TadD
LLAANANVDADIGRALDHLGRARTVSPGDPILAIREAELLSDRAAATGRQFDAEDAVRAWRGLAISDPNHPTVQLALGVAEITVGNEPEAEAAWKKAELLAPDSPEPAHNLAILFRSQGRDEEAAAAEARASALEENRS